MSSSGFQGSSFTCILRLETSERLFSDIIIYATTGFSHHYQFISFLSPTLAISSKGSLFPLDTSSTQRQKTDKLIGDKAPSSIDADRFDTRTITCITRRLACSSMALHALRLPYLILTVLPHAACERYDIPGVQTCDNYNVT